MLSCSDTGGIHAKLADRVAGHFAAKLMLAPMVSALPPDVRRGSAPPLASQMFFGATPLVWGFAPKNVGLSPTRGHSPCTI